MKSGVTRLASSSIHETTLHTVYLAVPILSSTTCLLFQPPTSPFQTANPPSLFQQPNIAPPIHHIILGIPLFREPPPLIRAPLHPGHILHLHPHHRCLPVHKIPSPLSIIFSLLLVLIGIYFEKISAKILIISTLFQSWPWTRSAIGGYRGDPWICNGFSPWTSAEPF